MLDFLHNFGEVLAGMAGRLDERNGKEAGYDVPLIVLDPTQEGSNLVFECLSTGPEKAQFDGDSHHYQWDEPTRWDSLMTGHEADQIAARHRKKEQPAGLGHPFFEPAIDGGQVSDLPFCPTDGPLAIPTPEEVQHDGGDEDACKADQPVRERIDEGHGPEQIAVPRCQSKYQRRSFVNEGGSDIRPDGSSGEENSRADQDETSRRR